MVEQPTRKPPEDIELRVRPRPVRRINRKVLMGGTALFSVLLFGAVWFALNPPDFRGRQQAQELYNTDRKPTAEGLAGLPSTYDAIPKLGPPLPGDFGDALHKVETGKGAELPLGDRPFQPDPEADIERVDRIRLARLAQQGRESKLFYTVATAVKSGEATKAEPSSTQTVSSPFAALGQLDGLQGQGQPGLQTAQDKKLAFLNAKPDGSIYNEHSLQKPLSPFTLMAGSIIPASLVTGLNSDLPGFVIGQVTENVYDTVSGHYLLVPQGTKIIGKYDSVVAFGQKRALVVWQRFIRPDGSSMVIDNLPATDEGGYAGLEDRVDFHTWSLLKGIGLATLLGVGSELTLGNSQNDLVSALEQSAIKNTDQAGQSLVQRQLDVQPTLTVRPGWPLRIIVHKDLVLEPYPQATRKR
jgi:type IV secretion system protein TrbI